MLEERSEQEVQWWQSGEMLVTIRYYGLTFSSIVGDLMSELGWVRVDVGVTKDRKKLVLDKNNEDGHFKLVKSGQSKKMRRIASKMLFRWLMELNIDEGKYPVEFDEREERFFIDVTDRVEKL